LIFFLSRFGRGLAGLDPATRALHGQSRDDHWSHARGRASVEQGDSGLPGRRTRPVSPGKPGKAKLKILTGALHIRLRRTCAGLSVTRILSRAPLASGDALDLAPPGQA